MATQPQTNLPRAMYRAMRERLGTRRDVARALGVVPVTLERRECGYTGINVEAGLAMRYLDRHGLHRHPTPRPRSWAEPGELREAFRILGWSVAEAARMILGPGKLPAARMSSYVTGHVPVPEYVARLVKVRLGLELVDPWPKRGETDWRMVLPEGMEGLE